MRTYETVVILNERLVQDEGKAFVEDFSTKISGAGGEILKVTSLGRKQFARSIKKHKAGLYIDVIINLPEEKVADLAEMYKLDDKVLRIESFVYDRPEKPEELDLLRKKEVNVEQAR